VTRFWRNFIVHVGSQFELPWSSVLKKKPQQQRQIAKLNLKFNIIQLSDGNANSTRKLTNEGSIVKYVVKKGAPFLSHKSLLNKMKMFYCQIWPAGLLDVDYVWNNPQPWNWSKPLVLVIVWLQLPCEFPVFAGSSFLPRIRGPETFKLGTVLQCRTTVLIRYA